MTTCKQCKFFKDREDDSKHGNCFAYPPDSMEARRYKSFFTEQVDVVSVRVSVYSTDIACTSYSDRVQEITVTAADFKPER